MPFDAKRYDREILKPLRGIHGRLPAGNLPARYAIEQGMSSDQLVAHLAALREFWRERANGPDSRAEICRLLLVADEDLVRMTGDAINDPAWWDEQTGPSGRAVPDTNGFVPPPRSEPRQSGPVGSATVYGNDGIVDAGPARAFRRAWQVEARSLIREQLSYTGLPLGDGVPERPAPDHREQSAHSVESEADPSADHPPYIDGLVVEALGASGDRCRVRASWPQGEGVQVRIRWAPHPPPWEAGATIDTVALEAFGTEFSGVEERGGGRGGVVAEVPVGYHVYVPFLVNGDTAIVGRFVAKAVAESVHRLRVEWRGNDALVTWVWPADSRTALVDWTSHDGTASERVSRADYTAGNGYRIRSVRAGVVVRVRAITVVGTDEAVSPVQEVVLDPRAVRVSYTLVRQWSWRSLSRRHLSIRVESEADCAGLEVTVVVGRDLSMPPSSLHGEVVGDVHRLDLLKGRPVDLSVELPASSRRDHAYWIRCFFRSSEAIAVVDPPVHTMKVS
jgi:hypothetical protein